MLNRDFTLSMYGQLLMTLIDRGYQSILSYEFLNARDILNNKHIFLRHDIDKKSKMTLKIAKLENHFVLKGIYYFRKIGRMFDEEIIEKVQALNHEIGYHYEVLAKTRGDFDKAIKLFSEELEELRRIVPVKTACMHGSPLTRWDNRELWDKYDYHNFDIQFDPYFDLDFNQVLYLTDTGRRWNGQGVSLRDKVESRFNFRSKSTTDVIDALSKDYFPNTLMINSHPHRWTDKFLPWFTELVWQNIKNLGKMILARLNL